ncbi:MAG TPA: leucyl/phenylalanyl-tRNA--protein transferase [Urbifossiella sp.]|nr:leucyl/phenylalanyl-tRNA--protein transferase [Urbifossiella sp.]
MTHDSPFQRGRDGQVPWDDPADGPPDLPLGYGGALTPELLLKAYRAGVFPWYNEDDPVVLWWSPDPRAVIELDGLHVSRRLARTIRSGKFRVTVDQAFDMVMRGCGENRPEGTWVTEEMIRGYTTLHNAGHAHSLEVWSPGEAVQGDPPFNGWELAGGIYGVAVGGMFAGESMFHRKADASKVALVMLVERLRERGFVLFDVQMTTEHTSRLGAVNIPRAEYLRRLHAAVRMTDVRF